MNGGLGLAAASVVLVQLERPTHKHTQTHAIFVNTKFKQTEHKCRRKNTEKVGNGNKRRVYKEGKSKMNATGLSQKKGPIYLSVRLILSSQATGQRVRLLDSNLSVNALLCLSLTDTFKANHVKKKKKVKVFVHPGLFWQFSGSRGVNRTRTFSHYT